MPLKGTQTPRVSIQSLITLGKKFHRISRTWIITETWFLARLFVYLSSFISQILEFLFWLFAFLFLMARQWKHRFQKLKETNIHLKNHHQIIKSRQTCSGVFLPAGVACKTGVIFFFRLLGVRRQARSEQGAPDTGGGRWRVMILMTLSVGFAARSEHRWRQKIQSVSPPFSARLPSSLC